MKQLPKRFREFRKDFPAVAEAYEYLGQSIHSNGPLRERERALVKFAISIGARLEGAAHAHVRKAAAIGIDREDLRQIALLAIPTIGFPSAMAAMSWIDDELPPKRKKAKR
jgi:4-carboxymuconolactone decarboxylase